MRRRRLISRIVVSLLTVSLITANLPIYLRAQTPTVLIPGWTSDPSVWNGVVARLMPFLQVSIHQYPENDTLAGFATQANTVEETYGSLPGSTIAIGHSNGGLVARQWSRQHPLDTIITLGTPHQGAPLFDEGNFVDWSNYLGDTVRSISGIFGTFNACWGCPAWGFDWSWEFVLDELLGLGFSTLVDYLVVGGLLLAYEAFVQVSPVVAQMPPHSSFIDDVNSSQNLAREVAEIPNRVAVVSVPTNWFWGSWLRAAFDDGETLATIRDEVTQVLWYYVFYIQAVADATDWHSMALMHKFGSVASNLDIMDWVYCADVSFPRLAEGPPGTFWGACTFHDGRVPMWSAEWDRLEPDVNTLYMINGPIHGQIPQHSDEALAFALQVYAHVPTNYGPTALPGPDRLLPGQSMQPDQPLISQNGGYSLLYQQDGNLVLYDVTFGIPYWASNTVGTSPGHVIMQTDGNLVIYDGDDNPVWDSKTEPNSGAWLLLDNYAQAIIYSPFLFPLWNNWHH